MYKTILVPLDGSPQSAVALPLARTLARATEASLLLVRVAADAEDPGTPNQYLRKIAEELEDLPVRYLVTWGTPAEQILSKARTDSADLIVMATHGRAALQRAVLGSVAEHVLTASAVPVLLVRPGGKRVTRLKTLLVPTDGTAGGALALGTAVQLARVAGARLVLVQVVAPIPLWLYGEDNGLAPTYIDPKWEEEMLAAARTYVGGLTQRLQAAGLDVEGHAVRGTPVAGIDQVADSTDADLIVMSTHAYTGPARALLGSTADALVRTAKRPVLMVRRPGGPLDYQPARAAPPVEATAGA